MSECMAKVNSEDPNMEDASTTMFMATSNVFEANVASQKVLLRRVIFSFLLSKHLAVKCQQ